MKPPIKALRKIKKYCGQRSCKDCAFSYKELFTDRPILYHCMINEYVPCCWITEIEEREDNEG